MTSTNTQVSTSSETSSETSSDTAIDYATPLGLVRLIIADTEPSDLVLKDPAVLAFLRMEGVTAEQAIAADPAGDQLRACRLAAANALDSIASSTVQLAQAIRTQDMQLDGAKAAQQLQSQARTLRAQVEAADLAEARSATSTGSTVEFGDY